MAIKANLIIDQGTDFSTTINVTDDAGDAVDLSTYTAAAQIRKHYTSTNSTAFSVTASSLGVVTLTMNNSITANLTAGRYVYDCELTDGSGTVSRLVEGIVTVTPEVTR